MQIKFGFATLGLLLQDLLPFAKIQFPGFFSGAFWDIEWNMVFEYIMAQQDQVWVLSSLTFFYRSYCPLLEFIIPRLFHAVFWDFDLKQIKFQFICFCSSPIIHDLAPFQLGC